MMRRAYGMLKINLGAATWSMCRWRKEPSGATRSKRLMLHMNPIDTTKEHRQSMCYSKRQIFKNLFDAAQVVFECYIHVSVFLSEVLL
jgi:hypothetical protein